MNVLRYKPNAIVTLYTETGELVARSTNDPNRKIDDDVVVISTTREIGADAPTFSISLTRKKAWHKWVASNDLIRIQMARPPEAQSTIFLGLVDDVRKGTAMTGDGIQRVITITGRGVSKAFIQFDIGVVPEVGVTIGAGWMVGQGVTLAGAPIDDVITNTWNYIGKTYVNYKWDNGTHLFDNISIRTKGRKNFILVDDIGLINWHGSLWAFLKEVAEAPFYELFWEMEGSKPTMIARPTPFNPSDWSALPKVYVTDEDIVIDDIGRSDVETYTIYSVGAKSLYSPEDTYSTFGVFPYWYEPYSKKYGIRRLHAPSMYIATSDAIDVPPTVDLMRDMQRDLYNWNIKNNSMFNGTLVVKGSNRFKIGQRLMYKSGEDDSTIEYYIVSVSQNYHNFSSWTTQLGLTRGLPEAQRFSSPWGSFTEFTGVGYEPLSVKGQSSSPSSGGLGGPLRIVSPDSALPPPSDDVSANRVIQGAYDLMNSNMVRYVFGGPGIAYGKADCSQFTQHVYKMFAGIEIGRSTGTQVLKGDTVAKSQLEPGDLVFFKNTYASSHIYGVSHVGIYVGDNKFMHLSSGSNGIVIGNLSDSFWSKHWLTGKRVLKGGA